MNKFTYLKDKDFSQGRNFLGASDIPTLSLCNLKYGSTPLQLWEVHTGRRESWKGNESTQWGHHLEGLILREALVKLGFSKQIAVDWYLSKEKGKNKFADQVFSNTECVCQYFKHLTSHADLVVNAPAFKFAEPFIIEAKSSKFFSSKRNEDENSGYSSDDLSCNGIPLGVYLQVQTQMMCYDINDAYVALLSDTSSHRVYGRICKDIKTQEHILAIAERFWQCVKTDTPPKPETWEDVVALNKNLDVESKAVVSGDVEQKVLEMKARKAHLSSVIKKSESELDDIKNAVGLILGSNAYLENASGESLAKAFEVSKETVSLSEIKKKAPEIIEVLAEKELIKVSEYRQLKF